MTSPCDNRITRNEIAELTCISRTKIAKVTQHRLFGFPKSQGVLRNREFFWSSAEVMAWLATHDLKTLIIYKDPKPVIELVAKPVIVNAINFLDVFSGKYATPEQQQKFLLKKIKARNSKPITTVIHTGYKK